MFWMTASFELDIDVLKCLKLTHLTLSSQTVKIYSFQILSVFLLEVYLEMFKCGNLPR
jgi:hypothetical protein